MFRELEQAAALGALRPIDLQLARLCAERAPGTDPGAVALAAALVSLRAGEGDVCLRLERVAGRAALEADTPQGGRLRISAPPLEAWLDALAASPWVGEPGGYTPLVLEGTRLYLGRFWDFEVRVARQLRARLDREPPAGDERALRALVARLFGGPAPAETDWQRVAAALAATRELALITGGPGTGKTTTMVRVLALLLAQRPGLQVRLLAPTGKAAARMAEAVRRERARLDVPGALRAAIPAEAATIHRFLRPDPEGRFAHDRRNPVPADVVVVDEASMVALPLMARLLDALLPQCRVVLLGDRHQLGSVEAGSVLADLCGPAPAWRPQTAARLERLGAVRAAAELAPRDDAPLPADAQVELHRSHRFGEESAIGRLAARVRAARDRASALEALAVARAGGEGLAWSEWPADGRLPPEVQAWIRARFAPCLQAADPEEALARLGTARILCALREGEAGARALNREAERLLGREGGAHYPGKPVLVTRNDYALELYNGDLGVLWRHPRDPARLAAWFERPDGGVRHVPLRQMPTWETAYALTVHKSQGSEYDEVLLVLPRRPVRALTRELVYTGITRARCGLRILADGEAFAEGCARATERSSGLAERLGWPASA